MHVKLHHTLIFCHEEDLWKAFHSALLQAYEIDRSLCLNDLMCDLPMVMPGAEKDGRPGRAVGGKQGTCGTQSARVWGAAGRMQKVQGAACSSEMFNLLTNRKMYKCLAIQVVVMNEGHFNYYLLTTRQLHIV